MNSQYICKKCAEKFAGCSIDNMSMLMFDSIREHKHFSGSCPECGSSEHRIKLFGIQTSYIKGYGFLDKKGAKRDMDIHLMTKGHDPYSSHRQEGEKRDVVNKLQKSREFRTSKKNHHMGR